MDWRSGRLFQHLPRETPFQPPIRDEEEAEEEDYVNVPPRHARSTPSGYDSPNTSNGYTQSSSQQRRYSGAPTSSQQAPQSYSAAPAAGRPSLDAYGAFSDPAPSGFGSSGYNSNSRTPYTSSSPSHYRSGTPSAPSIPEPDFGQPMVSRTMQYADPYAAVRASIAGGASGSPAPQGMPPSYESYPGYR